MLEFLQEHCAVLYKNTLVFCSQVVSHCRVSTKKRRFLSRLPLSEPTIIDKSYKFITTVQYISSHHHHIPIYYVNQLNKLLDRKCPFPLNGKITFSLVVYYQISPKIPSALSNLQVRTSCRKRLMVLTTCNPSGANKEEFRVTGGSFI